MKKKSLTATAVFTAVLLAAGIGLTGCGEKETAVETSQETRGGTPSALFEKTEKGKVTRKAEETLETQEDVSHEGQETKEPSDSQKETGDNSGFWLTDEGRTALQNSQKYLKEKGIFMGSAFLGYTADYNFPGREEQRFLEFPYIQGLPEDHLVEAEGDEWFLLVPESDEWTVVIQTCEWAENLSMELPGITLYEKQDGMPVILRCNKSSLHPNVVVLLVGEKGTYEWYPEVDGVNSRVIVNEAVGNLKEADTLEDTGWLYGMYGYWRCDTAKKDNGKTFCYEVKFMANPVSGNPTMLWLSGEDESGNFYWDGSYVSRGPIEGTDGNMETIPWDFDYHVNTPDGMRSGTIRLTKTGDHLLIQDLAGDSFFPYTTGSEENFRFISYDADGEAVGEKTEMEFLTAMPEVDRYLAQGMVIRDGDRMVEIDGIMCAVYEVGTDRPDQFVVEAYFAVNPDGTIYRQDYLTGDWEKLKAK